jgi:hypothetical protein
MPKMCPKRAEIVFSESGASLRIWQREITVSGSFCGSVGREEELHVRRRLLQRLQERVERRLREHVHFVDDVDLEARAHRRVRDLIAQSAHVVDARVRRRIDLDDVDVALIIRRDAALARAARIGRRTLLADQRFREDARRRRLARAARAAEEYACPTRFSWIAPRNVPVVVSCPTMSSKVRGRYLRARTR